MKNNTIFEYLQFKSVEPPFWINFSMHNTKETYDSYTTLVYNHVYGRGDDITVECLKKHIYKKDEITEFNPLIINSLQITEEQIEEFTNQIYLAYQIEETLYNYDGRINGSKFMQDLFQQADNGKI